MGCGIDWRRSFITTDLNPYYDSFVQWQFTTLKKLGKVVKDKRFAVYSPLDGQPCADHDRWVLFSPSAPNHRFHFHPPIYLFISHLPFLLFLIFISYLSCRATGEGVGPQEYTLIKMEALELKGKLSELDNKGLKVYLMAATLRPETMYGQTNCWVLPEGSYGAYKGLDNEVYILTERSALNLSYQEKTPIRGQPELLLSLTGQDLIGIPVRCELCEV